MRRKANNFKRTRPGGQNYLVVAVGCTMGLKPLCKNILNFSLSLMFSQIIFEISLGDINLKLKKYLVKTKAGA